LFCVWCCCCLLTMADTTSAETSATGAQPEQPVVPALPPISLNIVSLVHNIRMQNGIRHSLYQRYRHYCSRRLLKIRKKLGVKQVNVHQKGASRRFVRNDISVDQVKDDRYLMIPIFEAERAWAYAMELREEFETEKYHRTRNHSVRKFTKATQAAQHLKNLCAERGDGRTGLEAEAYYLLMRAAWLVEKKEFLMALNQCFPAARSILMKLSHVVEPDEGKVINTRLTEIETAMKFCDFNKHLSRSTELKESFEEEGGEGEEGLEEKLEKMVLEEKTKSGESLTEIKWMGHTITVPSGKIRSTLLDLRSIQEQLRKERNISNLMAVYDSLFIRYNDVLELIGEASTVLDKGDKKSMKSEARSKNLALLSSHCSHNRLFHLLSRNVLILHSSRIKFHHPKPPFSTPDVAARLPSSSWEEYCTAGAATGGKKISSEELVRLCDNVLVNLKEMEGYFEGVEDEESADAGKRTVALGLFYKAQRCYYVSRTFLKSQKFPESKALLDRTLEIASSSKSHFSICQSKTKADLVGLEGLEKEVGVQQCLLKARVLGEKERKGKEKEKEEGGEGEGEREFSLFGYPENVGDRVFVFPPDFQAVHCNPLLFDLTLDEIIPPSLEARKAPARRGLFGWW